MRVRDAGRAFLDRPSSPVHEVHFGLRGVRERATIMKAKLTVRSESEVDAGTEVELRVPASTASAKGPKGPGCHECSEALRQVARNDPQQGQNGQGCG